MNKSKRGAPTTFWTPERVKILKATFPTQDNQAVADRLGTTVSAVRNAAMIHKVKKKNRYWDKPEEDFLVKNWPVMSAVEIAEKLGKTRWAVINKYREAMNLRPK